MRIWESYQRDTTSNQRTTSVWKTRIALARRRCRVRTYVARQRDQRDIRELRACARTRARARRRARAHIRMQWEPSRWSRWLHWRACFGPLRPVVRVFNGLHLFRYFPPKCAHEASGNSSHWTMTLLRVSEFLSCGRVKA